MTDTAKRMVGPVALGNTPSTLYTVPALTSGIMRNVRVCNTTSSDATFTMSIGTDAAGTRMYDSIVVPAKSVLDWGGFVVLSAAEFIQAYSGTASALTLTVSGVEVS